MISNKEDPMEKKIDSQITRMNFKRITWKSVHHMIAIMWLF